MTIGDPDSTQTSRSRLLSAGKTLFARNGYEQTSTAAIAREAGSSESQLIRYFGGKAGLLEAIFNESWTALTRVVASDIQQAQHGRDAIIRLFSLMIDSFSRDRDAAFLFLFEGRRIRGAGGEVLLSKGFLQFLDVIDSLIRGGREDGSFRSDIEPRVMLAGMLGCAEGMIRERVLIARNHLPDVLDDDSIRRTFAAMVDGLAAG